MSEALVQEDVDQSYDDNGADAVDDSSEEPHTVDTTLVASTKMRLPLPTVTVARECDRHGVSDRCAASIISAVLQDVGIINEREYATHLWWLTKIKFVENGLKLEGSFQPSSTVDCVDCTLMVGKLVH